MIVEGKYDYHIDPTHLLEIHGYRHKQCQGLISQTLGLPIVQSLTLVSSSSYSGFLIFSKE